MKRNFLLASLSDSDADLLRLYLKSMNLEHQTVLFETGDEVRHVYFPHNAIISLVIGLSSGQMVETAMVGRDGVLAAASALDGKISLSRAIVQLAGTGMSCEASALKKVAFQSPTLLSILIRHEQTLYAQAQQSAACIASHNVEERFCRWLLRARDLAGSDTLIFTQEFLAQMLGVQRTSVSLVAHSLQQAGMIKYSRGRIQITDLEALQETTCECYETVNSNYQSLLGNLAR